MCNIAGYIGNKQAAPILIEMMKREEGFAGGCYTGIATLHQGRLHYTKLTGDTYVHGTDVKTTRITGGLHSPYKGVLLAEPQGSLKWFANRTMFSGCPLKG
ncbi:MAG: hypothetical protein GX800_01355, partial [Clostridiaceae bacterium]|nr:hypothetical protein [Clostridiaceae bacterium]